MNPTKLFALFALTAGSVGIGLKLLFNFEYIPNLVPIESAENKYFDYIIIGAGTAGSVLGYKLSKHSNYTILLIEAGGIFNGLSTVPIASTLMQGTEMDWRFKSVPQKHSSRGLREGQQSIPRGKGLGGSSQLNYLLHFSGLRRDFDEWKRLGADGWDYGNLQPFLDRHEPDENQSPTGRNDCESDTAKLSITPIRREASALADAFVEAESEMQKAFNPNVTLNLAKFSTKKGARHSAFQAYLRKAFQHKNLSIMVHAKAEKIEFNENKEAISVIVRTKSRTARVHARREIIISAGALHSPHILKLSGVGDGRELQSVGIILKHQSPGVGENLFDHMNFPLFVSINATASVTKDKVLSAGEIYRYLIDGSGVLSTTAVIGTGRLDDYGMILFGMGSTDEKALKHVVNFETETFRAFFPLHANASQEGFTALSTCLLPKSRGSVKINSTDVDGNPLIDPEYLKHDDDLLCLRNAVNMTLNMIATKAFSRLGAKVHWPRMKACGNFGPFEDDTANFAPSDRYVDCLIRHAALTAHHPGGTCAIGSVVDSELRVVGVNKLRVVDASVFPSPVSGVPNTIVIAVAERAAELILSTTFN